jgi:hypothetical protein
LVEVLIATLLLSGALVVVAALYAASGRSIQSARNMTRASQLASERLEQLRALLWSFADDGTLLSDGSSDLSTDPPSSTGHGLAASPAGSLSMNAPGYVDYLDNDGRWTGNGPQPGADAVFVRRWSVQPAPADPANLLVLRVIVFPLTGGAISGTPPIGTGASMAGMLARTAR